MHRTTVTICLAGCLSIAGTALAGGSGWVEFEDQTSLRMPVPENDPVTSVDDVEEKDYAWGDVDQDGDIDLIVVRKQPFTSAGKETNVLFMNEGIAEGHAVDGVLIDRTAEYATSSDIAGDQGLLTATNDRDAILVDVNMDGWLDIVTAPTLTDNQAKNLSHPRVYRNLGEVAGVWQGFRYEDFRIPQMHPTAGPRFCSVAAGDVTGDGWPDLWFGDYDSGGSQIFDFNNRLLVNDGTGRFVDQTASRMTSQMVSSNFGAASAIEDMNGDGFADAVKQTSLAAPTVVAVIYNDPDDEGFFDRYQEAYTNSAYFISVGDLNGDGRLDMVVVDDGSDRWLMNEGNDGSGQVQFSQHIFPDTGGFGGNSLIAELNNDGLPDVIITDVDVDIPGCSRRTFVFRNLGGSGTDIGFAEQGQVIPSSMLRGVHDVAVFDINGDGWNDVVMGRCTGTEVWMNVPPIGLVYTYPEGIPQFLEPGSSTEIMVQLAAIGGGTPEPGSGKVFYSIDGGAYVEGSMIALGDDLYRATLPPVECTQRVSFYFSGRLDDGSTFTDPPSAPATTFDAIAADDQIVTVRDELEGPVDGWSVESDGSLTSGAWEVADPNFTLFNGELMAPDADATQSEDAVNAFVTENAPFDDASAGGTDIDGGPTYLTSPAVDLEDTDGNISYALWFRSDGAPGHLADVFEVQVSNDDGTTWVDVPELTSEGTGSSWVQQSFDVGAYVEPTAEVRVRFIASDFPNDSVTEAGIDNFQVTRLECGAETCVGDIAGDDGQVDVSDLLALLAAWGTDGPGSDIAEPLDAVDTQDLLGLLAAWGACP